MGAFEIYTYVCIHLQVHMHIFTLLLWLVGHIIFTNTTALLTLLELIKTRRTIFLNTIYPKIHELTKMYITCNSVRFLV